MACRKDGKGRVLRKGEGYRKGDGRYSYVYVDPLGKKRTIYAKSLVKLREREEQLQKDQLDGLDVYVAGKEIFRIRSRHLLLRCRFFWRYLSVI